MLNMTKIAALPPALIAEGCSSSIVMLAAWMMRIEV